MASPEKKKPRRCGFLSVYGRCFGGRRSASSGDLSAASSAATKIASLNTKPRRAASDESSLLVSAALYNNSMTPIAATASHESRGRAPYNPPPSHAIVPVAKKKLEPTRLPESSNGISGELDRAINDHQRSKSSGTLVRASSSNVMVFGHLGNIRSANPAGTHASNRNTLLDDLPKTARERETKYGTASASMGNMVRPKSSTNPEELKEMGNEEYKKGRFAEALALYDRAIALNPERASYRSNKGAALVGLGRLLEAVNECREAVRIDPSYVRAHHRLAALYLRLGEGKKAESHFKMSGMEPKHQDITHARHVQSHVSMCVEARRVRDWHTVITEAECAVSAGADSAPKVLASKAEALLKLHRQQDAESALRAIPVFDIDASTKFFGAVTTGYFHFIRAQVDIVMGRFEEAIASAQWAAQLDPNNKDAASVVRKARAVASARLTGNELFKAGKFGEACAAYGEGLQHDPFNAVLLCNRAACRSKLGQWEKAVEDCAAALNVRPSYGKARLRRADCNAKMERWEAAIKDYEMLMRETPGDDEVMRGLSEAKAQLKKL
ncbi:TPR repeat-containing thioredoxin TTL4 [Acorus calamus]|uniref:TPR repeat-containing thioredoxin TTL4 n=1 Tax=Acorus calamus TaxID=4465 RepID=A0AAV9E4U3_ACOCL|nr:TPR repeat-containing thioredoxin TTL4 [Acorus calamus]